ncbi:hypothetical protein CU669_01650 [Paramagnetospirillum kuznetsovii]|uniref:Uncharacterized protein n=1 Tax=Paramagnetospirillum kuznetsovii TaxID=2053833 RepID=A0A364P3F9_9PROT|nr:hypothetical protein [Paramagnetospirillum kuznetsovii]RAU23820.1 hypothetical protein CU669_01650 [Paramagnetospirillum kuznetsovii]
MGGFFAPDPPSPPPSPPPAPVIDTQADAAQQRLETIERNRRGLYGTIATSEAGVLQPATSTGKTLLGD